MLSHLCAVTASSNVFSVSAKKTRFASLVWYSASSSSFNLGITSLTIGNVIRLSSTFELTAHALNVLSALAPSRLHLLFHFQAQLCCVVPLKCVHYTLLEEMNDNEGICEIRRALDAAGYAGSMKWKLMESCWAFLKSVDQQYSRVD